MALVMTRNIVEADIWKDLIVDLFTKIRSNNNRMN